jgi:uncharacterized damage-inducible protein DinB
MSLTSHMRKMARNNAWSNYRLHQACLALSNAEFNATRTSFFPSIQATLNHILAVDGYYIDALTGGGLGRKAFNDFKPHASMPPLAAAQAASDIRLTAFCDALTEAHLSTLIANDRGSAGIFHERCDDLLAHVFQHQIHHRGQVHAMLAATDIKPPQLDEYFLAFDHAARADDLKSLNLEDPQDVS